MTVELIECDRHVFEVTCEPGDEVPGVCDRTLTVRLLSGPALSDADWGRIKEAVVRDLIARGRRVYGVTVGREGRGG